MIHIKINMENQIFVKLNILANADDEAFSQFCNSSDEMKMICDGTLTPILIKRFGDLTNYLYEKRSKNFFSKSILEFRPEDMSWREFYDRMTKLFTSEIDIDLANKYARGGGILELEILHSIPSPKGPINPDSIGADLAAVKNHLSVLKWMKKYNLPNVTVQGISYIAENGNFEIFKWLYENNLLVLNDRIINILIEKDHLEILKWLKENNLIVLNSDHANKAAINGHVDILKWLKENNIVPTEFGTFRATTNGHINVLQWLKDNNLPMPDQDSVNRACYWDNLETLKWLKENNLTLPNQEGANQAVSGGQVEILQWMKENKLGLLNIDSISSAIRNGRVNVLKWMKDGGLDINIIAKIAGNIPYNYEVYKVIEWLKSINK